MQRRGKRQARSPKPVVNVREKAYSSTARISWRKETRFAKPSRQISAQHRADLDLTGLGGEQRSVRIKSEDGFSNKNARFSYLLLHSFYSPRRNEKDNWGSNSSFEYFGTISHYLTCSLCLLLGCDVITSSKRFKEIEF